MELKTIWKRAGRRALVLLLGLMLLSCGLSAGAVAPRTSSLPPNEFPYESYTYWEDFNTSEKQQVYCKPMYTVAQVLDAKAVGAESLQLVADVCTDENNNIYVLDSTGSAVYVLDSKYQPIRQITNITLDGAKLDLKGASGLYACKNRIYIADTDHARVLVLGMDGVVVDQLLLPDSELIPTGFEYRPIKLAIDSEGYTYISSDGSYFGAILYSPEQEFLGFYGANTVRASALDVLQNLYRRLFSNETKRAADELSLPFQFTDLQVGPENFIYTTTGRTTNDELQYGQVCILNPGGKDVLSETSKNFADVAVGSLYRQRQGQDLSGIAVDADGYFYLIDTTYGRVFWYDEKGNLLSSFGGSFGDGDQKGTFMLADAIALNGTDVLVSDEQRNTVTVFRMTEYGKLVRAAQSLTLDAEFAQAAELWEQVEAQDQNSQLAYRGLASACYDAGDYHNALRYAKLGVEREVYADAFAKLRTAFLERHFTLVFLGILVLAALLIVWLVYRHRHNVRLIRNPRVQTALTSVFHPFEAFRQVKEQGLGSTVIATVLLLLYYVLSVLNETAGGFAFTIFDSSHYNSLFVLLGSVGLILLWVVSNWLVCTLLGGIGKLREIYIITCYSLIPTLVGSLTRLICTHLLSPEEAVFLNIFVTACTLYTAFILIVGIMRIHDFGFGRFLGTTLLSAVAMIIIVFLLFLIYLLAQQIYTWLSTLFVELRYR